jgi:beta-barrel assembly-enhancing protease
MRGPMRGKIYPGAAVAACLVFLLVTPNALADRTKLKPGRNAYSPQQDIQLGRQAAQQVEREKQLCNDPKVDAYLSKVGHRLIEHLNTYSVEYPWEFHCVNDKAVNAFALPGGFVFINRGAIEAADNEAQLAAVMAHELSHVALRHGTNQATKAQEAQLFTGILGAAGSIFGGAAGAAAAGVGQLATGSVLLKYSRGAETQADVMGTQVLYDSGYDPRAMAAFFENLNASSEGKAPPQFFSDHPNPDNRIDRVDEEIKKLGGAPEGAERDSAEFEAIKREVMALPTPAKGKPPAPPSANSTGGVNAPLNIPRPEDPAADVVQMRNGKVSLAYPANWKNYSKKNTLALIPSGGVVDSGNGQGALAWGMLGGIARVPEKSSTGGDALADGTQKLLESLQQENEGMEIQTQPAEITVNGQRAFSTYLRNNSPAGGIEKDWVLTILRPEGLYYFIFVAPERDYASFSASFASIVDSLQFKQ